MSQTYRPVPLIVLFRRGAALLMTVLISVGATQLFAQFAAQDGFSAVDIFRGALIAISTAWLAWGAVLSLFGLFYVSEEIVRLPAGQPIKGRTVILVPVYNEDPVSTFSRVAAMDESLRLSGTREDFDFAILSDTTVEEIAALETRWFARLVRERDGEGRIYYRRRASNAGKKAGNIEDFMRHSGAALPNFGRQHRGPEARFSAACGGRRFHGEVRRRRRPQHRFAQR